MKRFFIILLILTISLPGCAKGGQDILGYQDYPMTVTGTLSEEDFSCAVTVNLTESGSAEIAIDSPPTLTGYSFKVDNGEIWVYYDSMEIDLKAAADDIPVLWLSDMLSLKKEDYRYSAKKGSSQFDYFESDTAKTVISRYADKDIPYRIEYFKEGKTLTFDIDTLIVQ